LSGFWCFDEGVVLACVGSIRYIEIVDELTHEPDYYEAAIKVVKGVER